MQGFSAVVAAEAAPLPRIGVDGKIGLSAVSCPGGIVMERAPPPGFSTTLVQYEVVVPSEFWWLQLLHQFHLRSSILIRMDTLTLVTGRKCGSSL